MIWLIIGRRQRGKTTLATYMTRKSPQRVIFDPRGMIGSTGPRALRVETTRDLIDKAMPALADHEIDEVVYAPHDDDLTRPFTVLAGELKTWVSTYPTRPLGVLIDELSFIEQSRRDPPVMRRVLRSCEPAVFDVFITCHRPADIPTNTRSVADYWILFHCTQEHDLEVVKERCGSRAATMVQGLTGRSFIVWDDAQGKMTAYPDTPDPTTGRNTWYVELRGTITPSRGSVKPLADLSGIAQNSVDTGKLFQ